MKLLLFSDIHVSQHHCQRLVVMANEADLVIGAGDFGSLRHGLDKTINWLRKITVPAVLVPGNAESYEELKAACSVWPSATVLHGNGIELLGSRFFGIGGGIPVTPFGSWSYDFTEDEAEELLLDCPENEVLISHSPPKGTVDLSSSGLHLGSEAVRKTIEKKSPRLVVCGHIHESAGKKEILRSTDVINAGPGGVFYNLDS